MFPSLSSPGSEVTRLVRRSLYRNQGAAGPASSHYPVALAASYRYAFPAFDILPRTTENEQVPGELVLLFFPYFISQQILCFL